MQECHDAFADFMDRVLPADVAAATRYALHSLAVPCALEADRVLQTGLRDTVLIYLCSGASKLVAHASDRREQVVAFHFAGDLVTLPFEGAHSYSLEALAHSQLLVFPYEGFLEIAGNQGAILRQLLDRSSISLQRSREKALTLGRKSALERVASFLLSMAGRIGCPLESGIALTLPMSRRDIADSLGLTIETVSRQFTLLRESGLIETRGRSSVILLAPLELDKRAGHFRAAA